MFQMEALALRTNLFIDPRHTGLPILFPLIMFVDKQPNVENRIVAMRYFTCYFLAYDHHVTQAQDIYPR